jgi:hypothetical protein
MKSKPKACRRMETIKIIADINGVENREAREKHQILVL